MNTEMLICNVKNELVLSRPLKVRDVKFIRLILGLSRAQFAKKLGYDYYYICRMERTADANVSKKMIYALRDNVINEKDWDFQKDLIEAIENTIRKDAGY